MSAHSAGKELKQSPLAPPDPGNAGVLTVSGYGQVFELTVAASTAETRTLTNPTEAGVLATVRVKTCGSGGTVAVTASNGLNVTGNTTGTMNAVGDQLVLMSVSHTTGYRWEILVNTGSVSLS